MRALGKVFINETLDVCFLWFVWLCLQLSFVKLSPIVGSLEGMVGQLQVNNGLNHREMGYEVAFTPQKELTR